MHRLLVLIVLVLPAFGGLYSCYDLLGREVTWSTLDGDPAASFSGEVNRAAAGTCDFPSDEGRFTVLTRRYLVNQLEYIEEAGGATAEQLATWADCLGGMSEPSDKNMACFIGVVVASAATRDRPRTDGLGFTHDWNKYMDYMFKYVGEAGAAEDKVAAWHACLDGAWPDTEARATCLRDIMTVAAEAAR